MPEIPATTTRRPVQDLRFHLRHEDTPVLERRWIVAEFREDGSVIDVREEWQPIPIVDIDGEPLPEPGA